MASRRLSIHHLQVIHHHQVVTPTPGEGRRSTALAPHARRLPACGEAVWSLRADRMDAAAAPAPPGAPHAG